MSQPDRTEREKRLAEALRRNLRRRKAAGGKSAGAKAAERRDPD